MTFNASPSETTTVARWSRADTIILSLILIAAAVLRLADLDLVSITQDEGIHGTFATRISLFIFEEYPLVGLPSIGIRNSALFVYLLAVPNVFFRHPLSGAAFIAALQVLSIAMCYRLCLRWFGRGTAVVSCVLLTFAPWDVIYARNMWPPSTVMPFAMALLAAGLKWQESGRGLLRLIFLTFILPQVHFSGFVGPVWTLVVLFVGRRHLNGFGKWARLVCGILIGLATWAPWIYWQHTTNDWEDLKQVAAAAKGKADAKGKSEFIASDVLDYFQCLLHSARISGSRGYWLKAGADELPALYRFPLSALQPASIAVSVGSFACAMIWMVRKRRTNTEFLLAVWMLLPIAMLFALRPLVHPHYLLVAHPIPFVFMGAWISHICGTSKAKWSVATLLIALVAGTHLALMFAWRDYLAADRLDGGDRYQLTYRQRRNAALSCLADAGKHEYLVAGPFSGQQPAYSYAYDYELYRASRGKWPKDATRLYWMDEFPDSPHPTFDELKKFPPHFLKVEVERHWQSGATRIYRLHGVPNRRMQ